MNEYEALIDPLIIRFTHSRIRPYFTGCGMKVENTLQDIIDGKLTIEQLPLITVVYIPNHSNSDDKDDHLYFSLNNRRLYVIKKLRELNLLVKNVIKVRLKAPLTREKERYTIDRCSLTASIMKDHADKEIDILSEEIKSKPINQLKNKVVSMEILNQTNDIKKLIKKNKIKQALSELDEIVINNHLDNNQRSELCTLLGLTY